MVQYTLRLRTTINTDGDYELVAFKDTKQYYRDIEFLSDENKSKRRQSYQELRDGKYIFAFNPEELIEKFLMSTPRKAKKFVKLKSEYFYIVAHFMNESARALNRCELKKSSVLGFGRYYLAIQQIYAKGFHSNRNFIKNYLLQRKSGWKINSASRCLTKN